MGSTQTKYSIQVLTPGGEGDEPTFVEREIRNKKDAALLLGGKISADERVAVQVVATPSGKIVQEFKAPGLRRVNPNAAKPGTRVVSGLEIPGVEPDFEVVAYTTPSRGTSLVRQLGDAKAMRVVWTATGETVAEVSTTREAKAVADALPKIKVSRKRATAEVSPLGVVS